MTKAIGQAGMNRWKVREVLASGQPISGVRFSSTGEVLK
jgi:hypothetical protein